MNIQKPIDTQDNVILEKDVDINFHIKEIAQIMNLDEEIFKSIIELFFNNIDKDLEELKDSISKKDFEKICKTAHKIAGSSGAVRFDNVREIAKKIELSGREQKEIDYLLYFDNLVKRISDYKLCSI